MVSRYIFALNSIFLELGRSLIDFEFNKRPLFGVHRYDLTDADENDIWLGISNTGISIYDKDYEIQLTLFNFRCIMEVSYRLLHKFIVCDQSCDKIPWEQLQNDHRHAIHSNSKTYF